MCQECTNIYPGLEKVVSEKARACLQDTIERIGSLLRICNNLEDRYRHAGIFFHKTECVARLACEQNTAEWASLYVNLEKAFLLDSYEDIFAPLEDMVERLMELSTEAQHVPSAAKAGELMAVLKHELLPPINALITEVEMFKQYISRLETDTYALLMFNKQYYQMNDMGVRNAWYDPVWDIVNNRRTVRSRSGEFKLFADWVYSLPEAQRALEVQAGHDGFNPSGTLFEDRLFTYSMDLIWRANEGFVPNRRQSRRVLQHEGT